MLKECAEELAPKLQQVFRKSLDDGEVPRQWKEAHIVPIHKGGSKAIMNNFRPIALTSAISKVMEKIICAAMVSFLTRQIDLAATAWLYTGPIVPNKHDAVFGEVD